MDAVVMTVKTTQDCPLILQVSEDRMRVTLDVSESPLTPPEFEKAVREQFRSLGIAPSSSVFNLNAWLANRGHENFDSSSAILFEGLRPVAPQDGHIRWAGKFFKSGFVIDPETDSVNYRQKAAQSVVENGQLLAEIIPPTAGTDGIDVFEKKVRAKKGKRARIRTGKNIQVVNGTHFHAGADGRIRWAGGILSVDDVLTISGDAGLATGDIVHPGALIVEGDIKSGTTVETKGDIEVQGSVEPSNIKAGGNLIVRGGVTGAKGFSIQVSGHMNALLILDADVEVEGNLLVEKEIVRSNVATRGAVSVPKGGIIGGNVLALGGLIVNQIGSHTGIRTSITVGKDFQLKQILNERDAELESMKQRQILIREGIEPLLRRLSSLPPNKVEVVKKLKAQIDLIQKEIGEHPQRIEAVKKDSQRRAKHQVVVNDVVYSDTVFNIQADTLRLRQDLKGPVMAYVREGLVKLRSLAPVEAHRISRGLSARP